MRVKENDRDWADEMSREIDSKYRLNHIEMSDWRGFVFVEPTLLSAL